MFSVVGRAAALGLPWLVVMAISVTVAYAMTMALRSGPSTSAQAAESAPMVIARATGSEACVTSGWMVYVGLNSWIHDPSTADPCRSETTTADD
jgi:predicted ABC-type sugar transport system permease subunit